MKKWILHGIWDTDVITREIEIIKKSKEAKTPCEILKVSRIMDIDEEILDAGFKDLLNCVYDGFDIR